MLFVGVWVLFLRVSLWVPIEVFIFLNQFEIRIFEILLEPQVV